MVKDRMMLQKQVSWKIYANTDLWLIGTKSYYLAVCVGSILGHG